MTAVSILSLALIALALALPAGGAVDGLPGTRPLEESGDLASRMVAGIDRFLDRELAASVAGRAARWHRDFGSPERYAASVEPDRARLRRILGVVDPRV